jgi:hypothetical protein
MPLPATFAELQQGGGVMLYLQRHRARAEYSLAKIRDAGFREISLYEGADGTTSDVRRAAEAEGWSFRSEIRPTEVGCALSMLRLWKRVVDQSLPYLLIFEDDVLPHPDLRALGPSYWRETPRELDFLFLGNEMGEAAYATDDAVIAAPSLTTHAYVVTVEGARRALALLSILRAHAGHRIDIIDEEINRWMCHGLIRWVCWNGTRGGNPFPTSIGPSPHSGAPQDIAVAGRDTGLFYQNQTLGSTIRQPDLVWRADDDPPGAAE